ncbi:MAG: ribose 5-phosphate isomerase B [Candidatus Kapabacteria bacterium]|nr:ribose 5-phosphate isomerase B [Candidatus Kapabacteria bacterium]
MDKNLKIAFASDHAGYELKNYLIEYFGNKYTIEDFGTNSLESVDYPDYAFKAAKSVANKSNQFGVIICGSGVGVSIVANKVKGIRAANCFNEEMAKLARQHNNANVLNLGARFVEKDIAVKAVEIFLNTDFEGGRHQLRVNKIDELSEC